MNPVAPGHRGMIIAAWFAYAILVAFLALGFLGPAPAESSSEGGSDRNLATVISVALALLALAAFLHFLLARLGRRRVLFALAPLVALGLIAWLLLSTRYYVKQTYLFDPFFQISGYPVPEIEDLESIRILAVGGSTTEGGTLQAEERYPPRLSNELGARLERDVVVHSAGKAWWTTKHSLMNYVTDGRRFNADVVVVMHAINDLYRSCSPKALAIGEYNPQWTHFYGAAINAARPPTFVRSTLDPISRKIDRKWYKDWRFRDVDFPLEHYQSLPDFERHLRALVRYIRDDGSQPVLMTQPTLLRAGLDRAERNELEFGRVFCSERLSPWHIQVPSPESLAAAMAAYNEVTRRIAREENVPLVDLAPVVPRTLEYFVDDVHHTPKATALIAREVADVLEPLLEGVPPRLGTEKTRDSQ